GRRRLVEGAVPHAIERTARRPAVLEVAQRRHVLLDGHLLEERAQPHRQLLERGPELLQRGVQIRTHGVVGAALLLAPPIEVLEAAESHGVALGVTRQRDGDVGRTDDDDTRTGESHGRFHSLTTRNRGRYWYYGAQPSAVGECRKTAPSGGSVRLTDHFRPCSGIGAASTSPMFPWPLPP